MVAAASSTSSVAKSTSRIVVFDRQSGRRFLIDSGAEISVIPPVLGQVSSSDIVLTAANGTQSRTYGPKNLNINFGLARKLPWRFEMADVFCPIRGADFLKYYGFLVNVRNGCLVDPLFSYTIKICEASTHTAVIFSVTKPQL